MRPELLAWEQSQAGSRRVTFDGATFRLDGLPLAIWSRNREVARPAVDPALPVHLGRLEAFLAQVRRPDPREIAVLLDAHVETILV